ncbi:zinc-dependent metalloprotease family protein [Microbulbifer sp. TRSA001]|uniref:zinc-dependent metalloprotease family protein n=1 Tax=Microbulbifer sp. TRSA001 TaxID=3243381 RepID=UPI00403A6539
MNNKVWLICLLVLGFFWEECSADEVTVLVLYTEAAQSSVAGGAIEDKIDSYIEASNDTYRASGIDITLSLASAQLITNVDDTSTNNTQNYSYEDALDDLTGGLSPFHNVPNLRNTYGADFVVLLRDTDNDWGGYGWVDNDGGRSDLAYSIVRIKNPMETFTHEIGHNMGLAHSRRQVADGGVPGIETYAAGHGLDRNYPSEFGFVTVMAYGSAFNGAPRLALMSNPSINCDSGTSVSPCGIIETDPDDGANSSKVLNARKSIYRNYRLAPTVASISFNDSNLLSCLTFSQFTLIPVFTYLNCANFNIESLAGLEGLTGLTYVNIQDNNIYSLQPLLELPNLQTAVVSGNDNAICSQLTLLEEKLGASNVIRSDGCFPLAAVLVSINTLLL